MLDTAKLAKMRTNWVTGWENEFNATLADGTPVDFRPLFHRPRVVHGYARLILDAGRDQLEVNTNPSSKVVDHVNEMRWYMSLVEKMQGGMTLHFDPRRKHGTPATVDDFYKSRLQALLRALQHPHEGRENGSLVVEAGNINAFHVHFGFPDVCGNEASTARNLLDAATPAITRWVHENFDITPSDRNRVWSFSRPERQPAPRWFPDFQALHDFFESIPRLIVQVSGDDKHGGEWDVDLQSLQIFGDTAAEGSTWWGTRIRPHHSTVEYRPTPTLADPLHAAELVIELDAWLERAMEKVGDRQFGNFDEAMRSGLIPDFMGIPMPKDEKAWWRGWRAY